MYFAVIAEANQSLPFGARPLVSALRPASLRLKLPLHYWEPGGLAPYVAISFGGDIGFVSLL